MTYESPTKHERTVLKSKRPEVRDLAYCRACMQSWPCAHRMIQWLLVFYVLAALAAGVVILVWL